MFCGPDSLDKQLLPWYDSPMTDLGLQLLGPGRKGAPPAISGIRELEENDLLALAENRETKPSELVRLSERHHAVARYLAQGIEPGIVAAIVGLRPARISQLQADPLFAATLELHREKQNTQVDTFMEALRGLSSDAVSQLVQRLEDAPEGFKNTELMDLMKLTADRIGYAPAERKEVDVNVNFGEQLSLARQRALAARQGSNIIDGEIV